MKQWQGDLNQTDLYQLDQWFSPSDVLLFDIETTGFSAQNSLLYMIGFCYYQNESWQYRILFNQDGRSEYQILDTFLNVLRDYSILIHYNGDGFDLPYLTTKCSQYQNLGLPLSYSEQLTTKQSVDLYKIIKSYRDGLQLPNLKLTTVEKAIGISRTDILHGGDLIPIYKNYLQHPDETSEHLLYQHNYEDITAMVPMLQLLHFQGLSKHQYTLTEIQPSEHNITLFLQLNLALPLCYRASNSFLTLQAENQQAVVTIPCINEELKYFLPDWKNYYYLPLEDTVIHKSIAAFVDAPYKEKAKKMTCFLKKEGSFIPCPKELSQSSLRLYQRTYNDTLFFVDWKDVDSKPADFWMEYLHLLIKK